MNLEQNSQASDNVNATMSKINELSVQVESDNAATALGFNNSNFGGQLPSNPMVMKGEIVPLDKESIRGDLLLLNNKRSEVFELSSEEIEKLTPHPYTEIVPVISTNENIDLKDDIKVYGFMDAIIITRDLQIVDGRARVAIAKESEILHKPLFK